MKPILKTAKNGPVHQKLKGYSDKLKNIYIFSIFKNFYFSGIDGFKEAIRWISSDDAYIFQKIGSYSNSISILFLRINLLLPIAGIVLAVAWQILVNIRDIYPGT